MKILLSLFFVTKMYAQGFGFQEMLNLKFDMYEINKKSSDVFESVYWFSNKPSFKVYSSPLDKVGKIHSAIETVSKENEKQYSFLGEQDYDTTSKKFVFKNRLIKLDIGWVIRDDLVPASILLYEKQSPEKLIMTYKVSVKCPSEFNAELMKKPNVNLDNFKKNLEKIARSSEVAFCSTKGKNNCSIELSNQNKIIKDSDCSKLVSIIK